MEAVEAAPDKSPSRFVIYVKVGTYIENVTATIINKWNAMIYGDGMTQTIVTGSKKLVDGTSKFATATFGKILVFSNAKNVIINRHMSLLRCLDI